MSLLELTTGWTQGLAALTGPAVAHGGGMMGGGYGGGYGGHGPGLGGLGFLWPLLVVVLLVAGVFWLVDRDADARPPRNVDRQPPTTDPAMATLRERYARGEMSEEEFQDRLESLRHSQDAR